VHEEGRGQAVVSGPGNGEGQVSGVKNEGSLLGEQGIGEDHLSGSENEQSLLSQLQARMDAMAVSLAALAAKHKAATKRTDKFVATLARGLESQEKWTTVRLQILERAADNYHVNKVLSERLDDHEDTIKDLEERLDRNDLINKVVKKTLYTNHSAIKNLDEGLDMAIDNNHATTKDLEERLSKLQKATSGTH